MRKRYAMPNIRPIEIFLIELVVYLALWVINDYLASLLSAIIMGIFLLTLLFSLVSELIERSKVPRLYYQFMIASLVAPLLAAVIYLLINGLPDWVTNG